MVVAYPFALRRILVSGGSMRPALEPGDRLIVVNTRIRRGDVIACRDPRCADRTVVKRVQSIDTDGVYVVGDNSIESTDSRSFGPVDPRDVVGRVVYRYAPRERAGLMRRDDRSRRPS